MTFATRLLQWYRRHGRALPWRNTQNAYHILVSEIMLQQTQVPRVLFYYSKWLKLFPDWSSLALASNADVIHAWAGLGYNRRALALRDIARHITKHGEPTTEAEWLLLKGIGPYTAAALAAFSLHKRTLPIDTNIRRVLGRALLGIPFPQIKEDKRLHKKLDLILPQRGKYYNIPQALFDLATAVCTKRPACTSCALQTTCRAAPKFLQNKIRFPAQSIKKTPERIHPGKRFPDRIYRGRILALVRRSDRGIDIRHLGPNIDPDFALTQDQAWLLAMIQRLVNDRLLTQRGTRLSLPQ